MDDISMITALQTAYGDRGFVAASDVAPLDLALEIRALFEDADYDHVEQIRKRHYSHVQKVDGPLMPEESERYIARFSRSGYLERHDRIRELVNNQLLPVAAQASGRSLTGYELRGYRMTAGDLLRVHVDDYVAGVGFIYYLSTRWCWDWGGILTVIQGEQAFSVPPVFNQLVVINHGLRLPHFVSQITEYAEQPRYMLVGLCR